MKTVIKHRILTCSVSGELTLEVEKNNFLIMSTFRKSDLEQIDPLCRDNHYNNIILQKNLWLTNLIAIIDISKTNRGKCVIVGDFDIGTEYTIAYLSYEE